MTKLIPQALLLMAIAAFVFTGCSPEQTVSKEGCCGNCTSQAVAAGSAEGCCGGCAGESVNATTETACQNCPGCAAAAAKSDAEPCEKDCNACGEGDSANCKCGDHPAKATDEGLDAAPAPSIPGQ